MRISASGKNGDAHFDGRAVTITKKRLVGGGSQQFPVTAIQAVNFKAATKLTRGYAQFVIAGQTAAAAPRLTDNAGMQAFAREANVVIFGGRESANFEELRDAVQAAIHANVTGPSAAPSTASGGGVADELQKLAALRDSGVLSSDEFEAEKRRVLGR